MEGPKEGRSQGPLPTKVSPEEKKQQESVQAMDKGVVQVVSEGIPAEEEGFDPEGEGDQGTPEEGVSREIVLGTCEVVGHVGDVAGVGDGDEVVALEPRSRRPVEEDGQEGETGGPGGTSPPRPGSPQDPSRRPLS